MMKTETAGQVPPLGTEAQKDRGARRSIGLMLLGALAMTSCCILPLALVSIGVTGVFIGGLSSLYQFHWYFLAFASATLVYGFWTAYRPINAENCASGTCVRPMNRTLMRSVLWVSLVVVVGAVAFQYLAPLFLSPF